MTPIERRIPSAFFGRVRDILESARAGVARSVNSAQVVSNWLIGQALVEEEQNGKGRAAYGERLLKALAGKLRADFGAGYSYANLKLMRQFYLAFPLLLGEAGIGYAQPGQSGRARRGRRSAEASENQHLVRLCTINYNEPIRNPLLPNKRRHATVYRLVGGFARQAGTSKNPSAACPRRGRQLGRLSFGGRWRDGTAD